MEQAARRGTVAVLGASGFIGRHVVAALLAEGWTVRAIARSAADGDARVTPVPLDLVTASAADLAKALAGCAAAVNVVGIKREAGAQTFEAVHVRLVERLLVACKQAGIGRLVHVSVVAARADGPHAYHRTKAEAERLVRESGLAWTILRPSVVYGRGDDLLAHLAKMVRASPVFPIVGSGQAPMQPVDVEDVAAAAARALASPVAAGRSYDVVGPERLPLRGVVGRVAEAMGQRVVIVPTPPALMRLPVAAMAAFAEKPLSTPAQLAMLQEGLVGDAGPARRDLGLVPRPFSVGRIQGLLPPPPGRAPAVDLRFDTRRPALPWPPVAAAVALGVAALLVGFRADFGDPWLRLAGALTLAGLAAGVVGRRHLADAWRPTAWMAALGLAVGVGLYAASWAIAAVPSVGRQVDAVLELQAGHPAWVIVPTLAMAVAAEEVLWRGVLAGGLAGRMPPWAAVLVSALAYSAGHLASGSPLLVGAAFGLGLLWGAMFLATRSLTAVILCHFTWEVLAAVLVPVA